MELLKIEDANYHWFCIEYPSGSYKYPLKFSSSPTINLSFEEIGKIIKTLAKVLAERG